MSRGPAWIHFLCIRCGREFRAQYIRNTCWACETAEAKVYTTPMPGEASGC
jgi:hypothetical protein